MPTSPYMPDIVVEVAWDGGFRIPMADWTWTDISDYVELGSGMSIQGGRSDQRSVADANTLTLTLDNSDGRFTAGRVTGAYYPDVKLYKPIRVLATPTDGTTTQQTLFTGYVTSWPVEWDGTSAAATATVTASSRLARLGLNAQWRSLVEQSYLFDDPVAYYPLSDPEGSTSAADASGNGAAPLTMVGSGAAVAFGQATGPGTDDLTAATFVGGRYLWCGLADSGYPGVTLSFYMLRNGVPAATEGLWSSLGAYLVVNTSGEIVGSLPLAGTVTSANVCDGRTHHVALVVTAGANMELFIDGVSVDTAAALPAAALTDFALGNAGTAGGTFTGVLAHFGLFGSALSSTRIAAHAQAGDDGYASELTSDRLERYAELAGIPAAEVNAETGSTTVTHVDTTGANVVDLLRLMETTEGGVLFDDRDGVLTMHSRGHRYTASSLFTLDMAAHEVEADYSPQLDPSGLVNDVTVTSAITSARKIDADSVEAYGVATASVEIAAEDDDEPLNYASWALYAFSEPRLRIPTLSVDALAQVGRTVTCEAVLAATIGDKITVSNQPSQMDYAQADYVIEGWSFDIGPESFKVTWNVSPSAPDDTVLVWGDANQGVWGTNAWAF